MSQRFYINLPLCPGPFTLEGPEAHHLATVSRLRPGDEVCLFNGDGREYPARIIQVARRQIGLDILDTLNPQRELPFPLEVAAPLPKGDRSQFLVEKLTELGVSKYVPLACERSNFHPREGKREKLERYVIEASKQCGRNVLMQIAESTAWHDHVAKCHDAETRLIAHPYPTQEPPLLARPPEQPHAAPIRIAVGPEGGFTGEELTLASQNGWQTVRLGPRILRVETAAIVLATLVLGWVERLTANSQN